MLKFQEIGQRVLKILKLKKLKRYKTNFRLKCKKYFINDNKGLIEYRIINSLFYGHTYMIKSIILLDVKLKV